MRSQGGSRSKRTGDLVGQELRTHRHRRTSGPAALAPRTPASRRWEDASDVQAARLWGHVAAARGNTAASIPQTASETVKSQGPLTLASWKAGWGWGSTWGRAPGPPSCHATPPAIHPEGPCEGRVRPALAGPAFFGSCPL